MRASGMRAARRLTSIGAGSMVALGLLWTPPSALAVTQPVASIGDATVVEPTNRTGTVSVELPVTLASTPTAPVSIAWRTDPGTATTADFVAASGTLNVPAGAQGGSIAVAARADKLSESAEAFTVTLVSATGATLGDASGKVTILPAGAGLAVGDVALTEPDAGTLQVAVPATLAAPAKGTVTFGWQLRSNSATVGVDAPAASGTGTIAKGALGTLVRVPVNGDTTVEPDETLDLVITSVSGTSLADGTGSITVRNNDIYVDPFGWNPPSSILSGSTNVLYVESPAGDSIGRGETFAYTQANSLMQLSSSAASLTLNAHGDKAWTLNIGEAQNGTSLVPGYYPSAARAGFYYPGIDFYGDGRGCNTVAGRFIVDSVAYANGLIDQVTARFEQRCETTGPALHGYLRWSRSDATAPPAPASPAQFAWQPPAGAVPLTGNYLYIASPAGDYIGQGTTFLDTDPTFTFTPGGSPTAVQMSVITPGYSDWWYLNVAGRYNQPALAVGYYPAVERAPFHNPATGGLDFSGNGRGCNQLTGAFAVDQISLDAQGLASITVRFTQSCEGTMPALYGALHWTRP